MTETDKDRVTMQDHKEIRKQMLSQMEQKLMKMMEGEPFFFSAWKPLSTGKVVMG